MELDEVIEKRRTIRAFKGGEIEEAKVGKILKAACMGPSAGNLQSFRIYRVSSKDKLRKLSRAAFGQEFISQASMCLVFCADPERAAGQYGKRGRELYSLQDATISAVFAVLKAVDEGLATAWVGSFDEAGVSDAIGAGNLRPVAIIPIGKPDENPGEIKRKGTEDLVQEVS